MKPYVFILIAFITLYGCYVEEDSYYPEYSDVPAEYNEKYADYGENPFISVKEQPVSTFSIDADGGSYSNMRRFAMASERPPVASVRIEEYLNYFNYDYPEPTNENVSVHAEICTCPWKQGHYLLRIGLKGRTLELKPPSNFVFLIDVSGSMDSNDKLGILKTGFKEFAEQLDEKDQVAIVTYSGSAQVLLESTPGSEKETIKNAINALSAGGSTAGAAGIKIAYEIAGEYFIEGGNNRVVLGTDGDFNVGMSSDEELIDLIETERDKGIYLTVLGVGSGNLNERMMEQIADKGNGNYEYIDNLEQMRKVFVYEYDKFYTVAKDCKIQVNFNEKSVDSYRLIGYENRSMDNDDFKNDSCDAGEIGASQTITALYQFLPTENIIEPFGTISFRYKMPDNSDVRQRNHTMKNSVAPFETASDDTRFAVSVAGFGMLMKDSQYKGALNIELVADWAADAGSYDPYGFKEEFIQLMDYIY